jgi:hypothetical protein
MWVEMGKVIELPRSSMLKALERMMENGCGLCAVPDPVVHVNDPGMDDTGPAVDSPSLTCEGWKGE